MTSNPLKTQLKFLRTILKLCVGLIVIWAAGKHASNTWAGLHNQGIFIHFEAGWLILAAFTYVVGLALDGIWYWRILGQSSSPVSCKAAVRAYLISHLGKYVPGKALVVIMRVALVAPAGARPATAAFATLYETLVMMAAGGLVAFLGFLLMPGSNVMVPWLGQTPLALIGFVFGCGFLVLTYPPVFQKLTRLVSLPFPGVGSDAWPHLSTRLQGEGLLWTVPSWLLLGLSQIFVLYGVGYRGLTPQAFPAVIGSVALATVAGFVVPISPGGLGVREWVLWTSLGATLDHGWAVVASLTLRLVWVCTELAAAAVLTPLKISPLPPLPTSSTPVHDLSSPVRPEIR